MYSEPTTSHKLVVCYANFTTSLLCSAGPVCKALYTNEKIGVSCTNQIDSIGIREGECVLSIIQSDPLSIELTVQLQEKINYYLQYILDGQLHEERPGTNNMQKTIELHLQHPASGVAEEFLSKVKAYIESEGIKFHLVHGALCV